MSDDPGEHEPITAAKLTAEIRAARLESEARMREEAERDDAAEARRRSAQLPQVRPAEGAAALERAEAALLAVRANPAATDAQKIRAELVYTAARKAAADENLPARRRAASDTLNDVEATQAEKHHQMVLKQRAELEWGAANAAAAHFGQMERSIAVQREEAAARDAELAKQAAEKKAWEQREAERLYGYAVRRHRIYGGQ